MWILGLPRSPVEFTSLQSPSSVEQSLAEKVNAWAEPVGKIVIPILVLIVAWWIKNFVDAALKEREIEVSTAQAMRSQLTILRAQDGLTQPQADAAALALASFGRPSIVLLIREFDVGTVETSLAADKALLVLGLSHQRDLCAVLDSVLIDRGGRFRIETHSLAAKHIGQAQCEAAKKSLVESKNWLKGRVAGDAEVVRKFREKPTDLAIGELRDTMVNALSLLLPTWFRSLPGDSYDVGIP